MHLDCTQLPGKVPRKNRQKMTQEGGGKRTLLEEYSQQPFKLLSPEKGLNRGSKEKKGIGGVGLKRPNDYRVMGAKSLVHQEARMGVK